MQYFLEHFGISVAAITGVLAARGKQVDLFGVLVLALVTALGGGTIRDVLLGTLPVFWASDPSCIYDAAITAVITFYLVRYRELPANVLMVSDAFALALFTMLGTRKAEMVNSVPVISILMGVTTGVGGGLLRDLLIGELPLVFRKEIYLYATAAFGGALTFVILNHFSIFPQWNGILSTLVTLLLRLAGIRWNIALPMFRPKSTSSRP